LKVVGELPPRSARGSEPIAPSQVGGDATSCAASVRSGTEEQMAPPPAASRTPLRTSRLDISTGPSAAPQCERASGIQFRFPAKPPLQPSLTGPPQQDGFVGLRHRLDVVATRGFGAPRAFAVATSSFVGALFRT
jgi:hypothetical protein